MNSSRTSESMAMTSSVMARWMSIENRGGRLPAPSPAVGYRSVRRQPCRQARQSTRFRPVALRVSGERTLTGSGDCGRDPRVSFTVRPRARAALATLLFDVLVTLRSRMDGIGMSHSRWLPLLLGWTSYGVARGGRPPEGGSTEGGRPPGGLLPPWPGRCPAGGGPKLGGPSGGLPGGRTMGGWATGGCSGGGRAAGGRGRGGGGGSEPRRPPVVPARLTRVPRSPAIVGTPVRSHRKRDHRSPASNRPREIPGVDPAAPPAGDDVAPAPAIGAANHVDGRSWPEPGDQRKRAVRTGAHVDRLRGERGLREGGDRQQQR